MPAKLSCTERFPGGDGFLPPAESPDLQPGQQLAALGGIIGELERLPFLTENRFLAVGTKLRDVSARLQDITDSSAAAARIMAGDEAVAVLRRMEQLLNDMDGHFDRANRTAELACAALGSIRAGLGSIPRMMASFKEQVGTLRMLKMLTNIQGACLARRGLGLRNVAADIDALSRNVHAKSTAIIGTTKQLQDDLESAVAMVTSLEGRQRQLTRLVVTALRTNISSVAEMHARCSGAARDVSGESADIAREVSNVVVAMQFQDITRQQMEHVREALDGMCRSAVGRADAVDRSLSREMGDLCALQSVQLSHAANELAAAVAGIGASLGKIGSAAVASAAEVHGLFTQTDTVGHAAIAEIEEGVASIAGAFAENTEANRNLTRIMLSVTTAMGEITSFAEDIDFLGSEIRLIALNAIIKAAQAGKEGAAFNVIAETVKRQSEEICRQASVITAAIRAITLHVEALQRLVDEGGIGTADGQTEDALRGDELVATLARLKVLTGSVAETLAKTDAAAGMVASGIEEALAALDCRDILDTLKRSIIARLEQMVWTARRAAPRGPAGGGVERVEQLYTMRSERKVHQLFEASLAGMPATAADPDLSAAAGARQGEEGFGDNVEFF